MKSISPYLNFNGSTEEAFTFYRSIFGGEFSSVQRFKDMPGSEQNPGKERQKIMHIALPLGKAGVMYGSDVPESMLNMLLFGSNNHIIIETESEEEARRLFEGLSNGGKVAMPLGKQFWGAPYGAFADKYGVQWMINYTYPMPGQ
jgi:PhnB protein